MAQKLSRAGDSMQQTKQGAQEESYIISSSH